MKIIISGSPKEIAKVVKMLNGMETEKEAEIPPLLTELAGKKFGDEENAPRGKAAEQDTTFASIKPRFEACMEKIKEANFGNEGEENALRVEAAEQDEDFVPILVRNSENSEHRKRTLLTEQTSDVTDKIMSALDSINKSNQKKG